jgi:hypothetical protein
VSNLYQGEAQPGQSGAPWEEVILAKDLDALKVCHQGEDEGRELESLRECESSI